MPQIPAKFIPAAIREKLGSAEFKARVREAKNQVLDYTEAEMLVRDATCNTSDSINPVLCRSLVRYVRTAEWPSVVAIMSKRLGSKNANHPIKVMQLIEILLAETKGAEHEAVWRDVVIQNQSKIEELKFFERVVDKVDTGARVRPLAVKFMARIRAEQHMRDDASLGLTSQTGAPPPDAPARAAPGTARPAADAYERHAAEAPRPAPPAARARAEPAARMPVDVAAGPNLLDFDLLSMNEPVPPQMQPPMMQLTCTQAPQPQGAGGGLQPQPVRGGPVWGGPQPTQAQAHGAMMMQQQQQQQQQQWGHPQQPAASKTFQV